MATWRSKSQATDEGAAVFYLRKRTMLKNPGVFRAAVLGAGLIVSIAALSVGDLFALAQNPAAAAPAAVRQIGTVKAMAGNSLTLTTDAGQEVVVSVADGARILQLAPGSTDLKTAQTIALADIAAGDRVLVSGKAGDAGVGLTASRVILMKSSDIAQKHEAEQGDWQKRGMGGIVSAVDAGTGSVLLSVGAKKFTVKTSSATTFRRYAGDSVKFEDAKPGTLAQIQVGDQLRVRGATSDDGSSIQAEEVVSGSFRNLAGLIATIDAAGGTLTLKDLATKKTVTVKLTDNSSLKALPPQAAARFAARAKGGASGGAGDPQASAQAAGQGSGGSERTGGTGHSAGTDLSQLVSRLPSQSVADLKVGDAVMIVASQPDAAVSQVTCVTLLSGVEPILAATPTGGPALTLSPWSLGGGADGGTQ
jgi:co-chaperonin GroES (HSP10)